MKRIMKTLALVAVAAMGLTACQNEYNDEQIVVNDSVVVTFVADAADDTRTSVDTSGEKPAFAWGENETFAVLEQTDALAEATSVTFTKEDGKAKIEAEFAANAGKGSYNYVTVYPESGYIEADSIEAVTLSLPAAQTMAEGSYDPAADLMVSEVVTTNAQPTEAQMVGFTRLAAVAKMTLKNFSLEAGDAVESVTFTAEGKVLAGTFTTDLAAPAVAGAEGSNSVTVATTSTGDVYFTVLPTIIAVGDSFTVTVVTNRYIYVKEVTIPEGKNPLTFEAGNVTLFSVNMQDVAPSDKWVLVKDASTLKQGDIVTFASKVSNVVMGAKFSGTSYPYGSKTDIIRAGDYMYHPITPENTTAGDNVIQKLIVVEQENNQFSFYNGVDFEGDSKFGFACVKSSTYFTLQDVIDANALFDVSIDADAVATVKATNSTVTAKNVYYYPSTSLTTRSFRAKSAAPTTDQYLCIYKIEGAKGIVDATIAVPTQVVFNKEASNGTIDDVKFNYISGWNISVSDNADWLTVGYADGKLTYTAEANENIGPRQATVTINGTCEGKESSWEFVVLQKGEPQLISVADFIKIEQVDLYKDYRVTGILKSITTKLSGSTTVTDVKDASKVATFKYIYLPDGKTEFCENKGEVAVGDIVTFVAPVTDSKTGGSSDAPAIYEGYYNISAEATADHVAYTGGEVEITISKKGTLNPQTINGSVSDNFAELEYTPGADKATLTLPANEGAPRQVVVTFTDGYATTSVTVVQGADTSKGNTWELVTDASTLKVGDKVIIAAKEFDVAISTNLYDNKEETATDARRDASAIQKLGGYYVIPSATTQQFVLMSGSEANTFAFYDEARKAFLVSSNGSSRYLINQSYCDAETSFAISISDDGIATIGNTAGDYPSNKLYYYDDGYFYSGTSANEDICLYRLAGVDSPVLPVVPASVTTEDVVIPEEGMAIATAIEEVVFNYVGDWTISASANVEWLTVSYADGKLTYTAQANNSTVREAVVTITAKLDGQDDITWTFNALQKGEAEEISIAELLQKEVNTEVEYKVSGRVKAIPSSSSASATFEIEDGDGNVAKVTYFYTEDDNLVKAKVDLKVGDVVTVCGAVAKTKGTIGAYANYTYYKAIYKGHYRLTATVEPAIVDYTGGEATINVELIKNGSINAPTTISGSLDNEDFAQLNYTPGAQTATVTLAANDGASREVVATFESGLASAQVKVAQGIDPSNKVGWLLVTNVSELAVGDKIIIAAQNKDYAISTTNQTSSIKGVAITKIGGSLVGVNEENVRVFTLMKGFVDGEFAITYPKDETTTNYLYTDSGSSDRLKVTTSLAYNASWTIEIDSNGGALVDTTYATTSTTTTRRIMCNYTESNQTFCTYKTTTTNKEPICIYKYYEE